jgi:sigma-E factor negative regulatory protein RseA
MSRDEAMKPGEAESQLSAMFDGELPSVECELLSRRIDRDEGLRARWSRYALIGAAMRSEPVATARSDFAARVSSAVDAVDRAAAGAAGAAGVTGVAGPQRDPRLRGLVWQSALAAALVTAVAGFSILMLRTVALGPRGVSAVAPSLAAAVRVVPQSVVAQGSQDVLARARQAAAILGLTAPRLGAPVAGASAAGALAVAAQSQREPWSYVTPSVDSTGSTPLRTELVDYIVAHSEYSTPLVRPDLLSELISAGEDSADGVPAAAGAVDASIPAAPGAAAGELDGISPPSANNH